MVDIWGGENMGISIGKDIVAKYNRLFIVINSHPFVC